MLYNLLLGSSLLALLAQSKHVNERNEHISEFHTLFLLRCKFKVLIHTIVKVFPDPVCPYAKMQTLYPSRTDRMSGCISANTPTVIEREHIVKICVKEFMILQKFKFHQPCVADGPNTLLKLKDLCPFPCFDGALTVIFPSSM